MPKFATLQLDRDQRWSLSFDRAAALFLLTSNGAGLPDHIEIDTRHACTIPRRIWFVDLILDTHIEILVTVMQVEVVSGPSNKVNRAVAEI